MDCLFLMSQTTYRILLGLAMAAMYRTNYGSIRGLFGSSQMNLSAIFPFEYMPEGWVFGLSRGVIFVLLGVWYIASRWRDLSLQERKRTILTMVLNVSWIIFTAQGWYLIAALDILLLLLVLIKICRLQPRPPLRSLSTRTWGIYTGWITIATSVLSASIVAHVLSEFSPDSVALTTPWTRGIWGLGLITTIVVYGRCRSIPVLIWSLLAMGASARSFFS